MKITLPHSLAAIFSALAALAPVLHTLQTVAPSVVPGPTGLAIAGGIGLALTVGHAIVQGIQGSGAIEGASKVVKSFAIFAFVGILAAMASGMLVTGCASIQKASTVVVSPQAQPFILAGVLVAVSTAEQHGASAAQINAVAKAAFAADQGAQASLSAVKAVLDFELGKLKLPTGDLLAISLVESEFNAYVQTQLGANPTLGTAQAAAADIFEAVIQATGG